jgi:hypothetical protein
MILSIITVVLLLPYLAGSASAQPRLERSVLASGAVSMGAAGLRISGTLAQPVAATVSSPANRMGLGFWYRVGSVSTHMQEHAASVHAPNLGQNYPNPFGPAAASKALQTRIDFVLPESGHATLAIFDVMGRQRAVLLDEHLQPGAYAVQLQAWDLPAGMYLYRLTTSSHTVGRKLLLMR